MWRPFKARRERLKVEEAARRAAREAEERNLMTWYAPAAEAMKREGGWNNRRGRPSVVPTNDHQQPYGPMEVGNHVAQGVTIPTS
jgi:hypothetical protein